MIIFKLSWCTWAYILVGPRHEPISGPLSCGGQYIEQEGQKQLLQQGGPLWKNIILVSGFVGAWLLLVHPIHQQTFCIFFFKTII